MQLYAILFVFVRISIEYGKKKFTMNWFSFFLFFFFFIFIAVKLLENFYWSKNQVLNDYFSHIVRSQPTEPKSATCVPNFLWIDNRSNYGTANLLVSQSTCYVKLQISFRQLTMFMIIYLMYHQLKWRWPFEFPNPHVADHN